MNSNRKTTRYWHLILSYVGIIALMLACTGTAVGTTSEQVLQIEDGVIEVRNEDGDWTPVAGDATFELVGPLESTDPSWTVAGRTLETNESTQIADGLEVGDLVRVQGTILEDDTWVAYSIQPAEEQTDPIIILIGVVDSVDPWVVNGIELNVTDTTEIQGEITPGMIVRVQILLLEDGTWEVLSIAPLGDSAGTSGCATVIATVVSISGDQIQFLGWPITVTLQINAGNENDQENDNNDNEEDNANDNENEDNQDENDNEQEGNANENENESGSGGSGDIQPGQTVLAVVCVSDNDMLVIVNIIILNIEDDDDEGGDPSTGGGEKALVCHKPNNKKGGHTLSISSSAVPAHLGHGDTMGPCP